MFYKADYFILEDKILEGYFMEVRDGKIVGFSKDEPDDYEDLGDIVAPGLVDTHIHGYHGKDIMFCEEGALDVISQGILECGVTSFLPTTLTDSKEKTDKALKVIADEYKDVKGAKVRGVFLEGPFFTEKYKGAQNPAHMSDPKIDYLRQWKDLSDGLVNKIALAPEREGVEDFIKKANAMGVYVALGHSDATYDETTAAVEAGANIFVHAYNGMRGLHHREPGMVGAMMNTDTTAELIADGHHVHPQAANALMNAKGRDKIALITDCMSAGGMEDGDYMLGDFPVTVEKGTARLKSDGSLAGSILKLKDGMKNIVDWEIADVFEAVQMASLIPAKSVGIDDVCGKLKAGYDADFIALDYDLNLKATYLNGEKVYSN